MTATTPPTPPTPPGGLRDLEAAIEAGQEADDRLLGHAQANDDSEPSLDDVALGNVGRAAFQAYREHVGKLEREIALLERDFTPLKQDYGRLYEFVQSVRKVAYDRQVEYGDTDENQEAITHVLHNYKESLDNLGEIVDILLASLSGSATAEGEGGER